MEQETIIFEPYSFRTTITTIIFLGLTVGLILYLYFYNKKEFSYQAKKRKGMVNMLIFTGILVTASATFLNWWNSRSLKPISISLDYVELPAGKLEYNQISKMYIYTNLPMTITTPPPDSVMNYEKSLIIEQVGRSQPHIFSEDDYPIDSIFKSIKERRPKK